MTLRRTGAFRAPQVAVLCATLVAGCAPRYGVRSANDDFAGTAASEMHGNVLGNPDRGSEYIELNAYVTRQSDLPIEYALQLRYRDSERWLRIRAGESLVVLADSQRLVLKGFGSHAHRRRYFGRGVEELASYPVTMDILHQIARASRVRLRIIGAREYVEREFTPRNQARFRAFVDQQVDGKPLPPDSARAPHGWKWWPLRRGHR